MGRMGSYQGVADHAPSGRGDGPQHVGGYRGKAIVGGGTVTDAPNDLPPEVRTQSAGARRMALYRVRRRRGLRCVMIELLDVEINMLIRRGWLARKRADPLALRDAFHVMLDDVLR